MLYDLCIIGSGPAGMIVALEYTKHNSGKKVIIIEYGNGVMKKNSLDDSIEVSNLTNHFAPYDCTNKGLGGTSQSWGGRCVTYDEVDFIERPVLKGECTWHPGLYKEVNEFLPRAAEYFDCGQAIFSLENQEANKRTPIAENFKKAHITDEILERWSMPTRFGAKYKKIINKHKNLNLIQGWEAKSFCEPDALGNITGLKIENSNGELKTIYATRYVIAAGTQESTRLLLKNPQVFKNLPEIPKALGKYYQGHLSGKIASVVFTGNPEKTEYGFLKDQDGVYLRRRFQFTKNFLTENNLLNTAFWLDNPLYYKPEHKNGAMSLMYLIMLTPWLGSKLAPPAIKDTITKGKVEKLRSHFYNVARDFPNSFIIPAKIFFKRYLKKRKLPGIFLYNKNNEYALHFHSEQIPLQSNNMQLSANGEKLKIHYELSEEDINSVIKTHDELDKWLRKCKCGRLEYWFTKDQLFSNIKKISRDGLHQVGTIRIADTAQKGVVNSDLRVFGSANLYVCSSAVFPTSGQANPTFYLGAFAARLAQYLTKN